MPKRGPQNGELLGVWHFNAAGHTVRANEVVLHLLEVDSMNELQGRSLDALLALYGERGSYGVSSVKYPVSPREPYTSSVLI